MYGHGDWYGPRHIMDRDVVYVTFNYRLGPLGKNVSVNFKIINPIFV